VQRWAGGSAGCCCRWRLAAPRARAPLWCLCLVWWVVWRLRLVRQDLLSPSKAASACSCGGLQPSWVCGVQQRGPPAVLACAARGAPCSTAGRTSTARHLAYRSPQPSGARRRACSCGHTLIAPPGSTRTRQSAGAGGTNAGHSSGRLGRTRCLSTSPGNRAAASAPAVAATMMLQSRDAGARVATVAYCFSILLAGRVSRRPFIGHGLSTIPVVEARGPQRGT
jgi:hypothetical protein